MNYIVFLYWFEINFFLIRYKLARYPMYHLLKINVINIFLYLVWQFKKSMLKGWFIQERREIYKTRNGEWDLSGEENFRQPSLLHSLIISPSREFDHSNQYNQKKGYTYTYTYPRGLDIWLIYRSNTCKPHMGFL